MAGTTLDELPVALALNGGELVWLYQQGPTEATPWIGVRSTTSQIATFINYTLNLPSSGYISMRQLVAALADQGVLVSVTEALTSDITNSYNIAWTHGYITSLSDPFITGFLQPTLGYSTPQMQNLFNLARNFPV